MEPTINVSSQTANTENSELKTSLTYEDKVIEKITGRTLTQIPGILAMDQGLISNLTGKLLNTKDDVTKGVGVEVGEKQVAVDLGVIVEYGKSIPDILKIAAQKVSDQIKQMTGLDVIEFNMNVKDIMTKQEFEEAYSKNKETAVQSAEV